MCTILLLVQPTFITLNHHTTRISLVGTKLVAKRVDCSLCFMAKGTPGNSEYNTPTDTPSGTPYRTSSPFRTSSALRHQNSSTGNLSGDGSVPQVTTQTPSRSPLPASDHDLQALDLLQCGRAGMQRRGAHNCGGKASDCLTALLDEGVQSWPQSFWSGTNTLVLSASMVCDAGWCAGEPSRRQEAAPPHELRDRYGWHLPKHSSTVPSKAPTQCLCRAKARHGRAPDTAHGIECSGCHRAVPWWKHWRWASRPAGWGVCACTRAAPRGEGWFVSGAQCREQDRC